MRPIRETAYKQDHNMVQRTPYLDKLGDTYTDTITLSVGKHGKLFHIHKDVLCSSSTFLQAACHGDWKESHERTIPLREISSSDFGFYIHWLYTNTLVVSYNRRRIQYKEPARMEFHNILALYALGDYLGDLVFCDAVTDKMVWSSHDFKARPDALLVHRYWRALGTENSGIRRLLIDLEACFGESDELDDLPEDFVVGIAKASVRDKRLHWYARWPEKRVACTYHDHEGGPCSAALESYGRGSIPLRRRWNVALGILETNPESKVVVLRPRTSAQQGLADEEKARRIRS